MYSIHCIECVNSVTLQDLAVPLLPSWMLGRVPLETICVCKCFAQMAQAIGCGVCPVYMCVFVCWVFLLKSRVMLHYEKEIT